MGKSNAKKWRDKQEQEGKRNPESSRSSFAFADLRTRKTKTKKDYLFRNKHKNHLSQRDKDGSFYLAVFYRFVQNNHLFSFLLP